MFKEYGKFLITFGDSHVVCLIIQLNTKKYSYIILRKADKVT